MEDSRFKDKIIKAMHTTAVVGAIVLISFEIFGYRDKGNSSKISPSYEFPILFKSEGKEQAFVLYDEQSSYGRILVFDDPINKTRYLTVDGAMQTAWDLDRNFTSPHLQKMAEYLKKNQDTIQDIAIIGMGGGSFLSLLEGYSGNIDVVEINPKVIESASVFFNLPKNVDLTITNDDGRHFLIGSDKKYDAIIVDICEISESSAHLFTREFYELASSRLREKGVLFTTFYLLNEEANNSIGHRIAGTLNAIFSSVSVFEGEELLGGRGFGIVGFMGANEDFPSMRLYEGFRGEILKDQDIGALVHSNIGVGEYLRSSLVRDFGYKILTEN